MDSRSFCNLVAGCSGRMLGFRYWCFLCTETCTEYPCILYQRKHQPFCSGGDHYSPDQRYSYFHCRNMAFVPYFFCPSHTQEWHQTVSLWWLPAGTLQGFITGWTGLLLVSIFPIYISYLISSHRLFFPQDHYHHESRRSDHVVWWFDR